MLLVEVFGNKVIVSKELETKAITVEHKIKPKTVLHIKTINNDHYYLPYVRSSVIRSHIYVNVDHIAFDSNGDTKGDTNE